VKELLVIEGGNHIQYMDASIVTLINLISGFIEIPHIGNEPADITVEEQHRQSSQAYLRFFNTFLLNTVGPTAQAGENVEGYRGEEVMFDGSESTASSGYAILNYEWDFENDGIIDAEGVNPVHTFNQIGQYNTVLYITDSFGKTATDTVIVTIRDYGLSAAFSYSPSDPTILDLIGFQDTSEEAESPIVAWLWDFGDGTTSSLQNVTHRFLTKGIHEVTLTVTDGDEQASITYQLIVRNLAPTVNFTYTPMNPKEGEEIQFMDLSTDPENQSFSRFWDFGDRTTSSQSQPTHIYTEVGEYQCTLTVTDDENTTNSMTMQITVIHQFSPIAAFTYTPNSPTVGETVQFTDLSSDPQNRELTVRTWNFGDGTLSTLQNPSHQFTSKGNYTVTLTVSNDEQLSGTVTMTIGVTEGLTLPFPLWVIAVIVIVVGGVSIYLVRARFQSTS
jgi:PKD repeat protein